jgi:hypothetical protein
MNTRRMLLTAGGLLLLSTASLSAQAAHATKVTCKDGTPSAGGQGACSSHGGIAATATMKADKRLTKSDAKPDAKLAKAETKSTTKDLKAGAKSEDKEAKGATALCKDNTYSHAKNRQGMCSAHGGVAKVMGK